MSDCLSHQHSHPSTPATARLPNPFFNDQWLISLPAIPSATSNHTPEFANATRTVAAHRATLEVTKALAGLGVRVLWDDVYLCKVSGVVSSSLSYGSYYLGCWCWCRYGKEVLQVVKALRASFFICFCLCFGPSCVLMLTRSCVNRSRPASRLHSSITFVDIN